jgi:hypothetical protein
MSLILFIAKWAHPDNPPKRVAGEQLAAAERHFQCKLPPAYITEVLQHGLPNPTIRLLDSIVEQSLNHRDVSSFFTPSEIIEETTTWHPLGLPENLIAVASDCSGNLFCFRMGNGGVAEPAIWFFDHDFGTVSPESPSFEAWIEAFCRIEPTPSDD